MADVSKVRLPGVSEPFNIKDAEARQMINNLPVPMQYKGTLGTGGTYTSQTFPTASSLNTGWVVKVITAGIYQEIDTQVGDMLISDGSQWVLIPSGGHSSGGGTVISVSAGDGLKITGTPTVNPKVEIDSDTVFILNCGDSTDSYDVDTESY